MIDDFDFGYSVKAHIQETIRVLLSRQGSFRAECRSQQIWTAAKTYGDGT